MKDSRFYQIFAFDMIIDKDLKVWLIDVKNAPLLKLKHKTMVNQFFNHIFSLNEMRNSKLYDVFRRLFSEVVSLMKQSSIDLSTHETFVNDLKNHFVFKRERTQVKAAMRHYSDYIKLPADFKLLYDGRIGFDHLLSPSLEVERFKLKLKYNKVNRV